MNKNNKNKIGSFKRKIALSATIVGAGVLLSSTSAMAELKTTGTTTAGSTPQMAVQEYTLAELKEANCDPKVWTTLVTNYLKKRGAERPIQGQIQVVDQATAAPPVKPTSSSGGAGKSCWENALGNLKDGAKSLDGLLSLFSGNFNWDAVADKVINQVSDYACNQLNNYTNEINYGIRSQVGNVTGGLNDTMGSIGVKNDVINMSGNDVINAGQKGKTGSTVAQDAFDKAVSGLK